MYLLAVLVKLLEFLIEFQTNIITQFVEDLKQLF
jgi:hypothetical protein